MTMSLYPKLWSDSPRRHLPSWSRPALSKRPLNVGTLIRDVPKVTELEASPHKPATRIQQLEKNIIFLKQQHRETLQHLHEEIEGLKNENRELNFKLIMCRCGHVYSRGRSRTGRGRGSPGRVGGERLTSGGGRDEREEEIRRLRNALGTEKNRNKQLITVIERKVLDYQKTNSESGSGDGNALSPSSSVAQSGNGNQLYLSSRQPVTLEECETVIRQLQHKNGQQTHELMRIKSDLRDVLYSHKWTPDAYLLARAYVVDGKCSKDSEQQHDKDQDSLPEVAKKPHDIKLVEHAYQRVKEEVTLPALNPKLPATVVAERHRRQQAVRTKLSRSVL